MEEWSIELPSGGFTLDYDNIANAKELMGVTRSLATRMMTDSYINVGEYIKELSDENLMALIVSSGGDDELEAQYEDAFLVAEMLANGEGLPVSKTLEDFSNRLSQLVGFVTIESLRRKGLVKVYYENMSFGEDVGDKILVERV
jgi:hypothetical protein